MFHGVEKNVFNIRPITQQIHEYVTDGSEELALQSLLERSSHEATNDSLLVHFICAGEE